MEVGTTARHHYISRIVEAATAACRLYGPSKTNVADIARLLERSPASVYKIFPSRAAIWDAIAGNFFETDLRFTASASGELISAAGRLKETALGQHQLMLEARHGDCQMSNLVGPKLGHKGGIHGRSRRKNIGKSKGIFLSL